MVDEDIEADHHEENEKTLDFYIGREKVRSVDRSHIASVEKRP
jgi:hypothetical protein